MHLSFIISRNVLNIILPGDIMIFVKKLIPFFIVAAVSFVFILFNEGERKFSDVSSELTDKTIIIDAGHGGVDGGAVSADGTNEKDINLAIALEIENILTSQGYNVVLTRDGDYSIHDDNAETIRSKKVSDLKNRLGIIENTKNAVFVSIHQNYFTQSQYSGAQVFYSPNNPDSQLLAECIQKSIVSNIQPENNRQIKKSDSSIFLLYKSTVPSVMVECGFLSNFEETEKLKNEEYRKQIAQAVCSGIKKFLDGWCEEKSTAVY